MARLVMLAAAAAMIAGPAAARDQLWLAGSSTVFPFAAAVAEQFGKATKFKSPIVESIGTGGGFKLFCNGVGAAYPDMANASRAVKPSELEACRKSGVAAITEVKIGYDGIVLAHAKTAPRLNLSKRQLFLALAKSAPLDGKLAPNPYRRWSDIDAALPKTAIEVFGPPPTSGTRDAFLELVMDAACREFPALEALKGDERARKQACNALREDGAFIEAGENDNLIVQKLVANPNAFGLFGFSFLDQNADRIRAAAIDGVEPTYDTIAAAKYGVARPLFIYVKNAHAGTVPGIKEFLAELTSDKAAGPDGYLGGKGLIPLPDAERKIVRERALGLRPLAM